MGKVSKDSLNATERNRLLKALRNEGVVPPKVGYCVRAFGGEICRHPKYSMPGSDTGYQVLEIDEDLVLAALSVGARESDSDVYYSVAYQGSGGGFHGAGTFSTLAEAKEEAEYRCAMRHFAEIHKYDGDEKTLVWECGSML